MIRAAIYCRVSTEEQAAEGMSITAQRKQLVEFASKNHMIVADEFIDEGVSARTADRPQFQRMISAAKRKPRPFDIILIHKTDRFARNREDAIVYKSLLRRDCDIEVKSITEQFEDSPTGKLLEGMMEVMAEFYSLNLSQEVMKGMKEGASQGKAMGMAPLGYQISETGRFEIVPEEAAVVRWIFNTYVKEQKGLLTVAHRLHTDGVRLFGPAGAKYKWSSVGIRVIITNPVYLGALVWNRRDGAKKHRFRKPEDWIVVEGAHEPIIDKETFDLADQLLKGRRGVRNPVGDYMLRGMALCADCGGKMCYYEVQWRKANGDRRHIPQLSCSMYHRSRQCYFNHVPIEDVEAVILEYLTNVLEDRVEPNELAITFPHLESIRSDANELRRQLEALAAKSQRQLEAYEAGAIDIDELKAGRERLTLEREALQRRLLDVENKLNPDATAHIASVKEQIEKAISTIANPAMAAADRRAALQKVVDHIEYSRRQDSLKIVLCVG